MQIVGALLAVAGVAIALPGGGDGGYSPGHNPVKQECVTSSTCKAVYHSSTKTVPYQETKTITKTEYKPHVYTTKVPKVYTETQYVDKEYHITKTIPITKTVTVPDHSTTVVCKTSTVSFDRTSCITTWEHSTCPQTTKVPKTHVKSTYHENKVTTSTPCPYTTTEVKKTWSTSVCKSTSHKCETSTHCTEKHGYPTQPPKYEPEAKPTY
ncbi:hypothetical protein CERZMDRAFT_86034 [Cercospora zeae-maydis SCOH1-5]|uniref:Uncharacterized protein n=1 Tax=Cercospora zeae-maydis SCOH1-5 TaxID=717836 RepID=A0A6A6FBE1_9PEZI|nr:hypothetical protein CERZMDRAFT_86034 [Cercospora zeae-maydis SCOH1-5]